ncbi:MAG TPA: energy transducer TonB, partial [Terriglobales bacterium]|nr:energy transducer TonB [Terriglobales bacterium]
RKKKKTGTDVISFVVDEHGIPRQLEIKHTSDHGFDRVALDAVKQWRFEPATVDGEPTPVITDAEISFRLY